MTYVRARDVVLVASFALAGCVAVREPDTCVDDACEAIPLPARNLDSTEIDPDAGAAKSRATPPAGPTSEPAEEDAGTDAPVLDGGGECDERSDCASGDYCCYVPGDGAECSAASSCSLGAGSFIVCKSDADCPGAMRCIAQTNVGHKACF